MHSFIRILGKDIPLYSLFAIAGAVAIIAYCTVQCRFPRKNRVKIESQDMLFMLIYAAIGAVIGAKLMYIVTSVDFNWYPDKSFFDNIKIWAVLIATSGLVFYGGLIGAALGAIIYIKKFKTPCSEMLDIAFAGVPLFHSFGRIGCFMAGCCYGTEYHGPFSVVFPEGNIGMAPAGIELLPVQLIEAAVNLILWAVLVVVYNKTVRRWLTSGLYLICYGILRFILEFFRGDLIRGHISFLSSSQFISFFIIAAGVVLIVKPAWLDRIAVKNDKKYLLWVADHKEKIREYKEKKAAGRTK